MVPLADLIRGRGAGLDHRVLGIGILRSPPCLGSAPRPLLLPEGAWVLERVHRDCAVELPGGHRSREPGLCAVRPPGIERQVLWILPIIVRRWLGISPLIPVQALVLSVSIGGCPPGPRPCRSSSLAAETDARGQRIASSITMGVTRGLGGSS